MKIGKFVLLPAEMAATSVPSMSDWQDIAESLVHMQRHANWWLGDLMVSGEAQLGDDVWQAVPEGVSIELLERCAGVSRKYPPDKRNPNLSWTHHVMALRIPNEHVRQAALRQASENGMSTSEFSQSIKRFCDKLS